MKLLNQESRDGGRIFWIVKEPIAFDLYEEEMNSLKQLKQLKIEEREDGLDVSFFYFEEKINIEVTHPFGTNLHPNARSYLKLKIVTVQTNY